MRSVLYINIMRALCTFQPMTTHDVCKALKKLEGTPSPYTTVKAALDRLASKQWIECHRSSDSKPCKSFHYLATTFEMAQFIHEYEPDELKALRKEFFLRKEEMDYDRNHP